jgi:hypothetical protein
LVLSQFFGLLDLQGLAPREFDHLSFYIISIDSNEFVGLEDEIGTTRLNTAKKIPTDIIQNIASVIKPVKIRR